jgi:HEAT repeat protein
MMDCSVFAIFHLDAGQSTTILDPFEWLYGLCAETIGKIGDQTIAPELIRIIQDSKKDQVRPYACKAVGLLRVREAHHALVAALQDKNMDTGTMVRKEAEQALKLLDEVI